MPMIIQKTAHRFTTRTGVRDSPIVFSHGWPSSADDWDAQMLFFGQQGYRVIALIGADTATPPRLGRPTTWTLMRRSGGTHGKNWT